ncbi:MAG: peptidase S41 [Deltaproteobacteria bacterium CG11_big_fil_rev_8_21_14_0_20_49_13]|nr:MAG: peptidase S41 [Deltaproteobacteria bacterium CG11_big_fil_rev_8_21_14_0_20_49_13]
MRIRCYKNFRMTRKLLYFIVALGLLVSQRAFALSESGFKNLHIFSKILSQVEKNYVENVNDTELVQNSIRGMLSGLDPHTVYMPPQSYKELRTDTAGKFGGVGVEVWVRGGMLTVVAPIEGSPADRAGLKSGDKIIRIDGKSTRDLDLSQSILQMRGNVGSKMTMTIQRDDPKKTFDVTMTREVIKVPSIRSEVLDKEYGYVKIRSFQERTAKDLKKELDKLRKKNALKGLIIDMRDNPGGLLDQAVEVVDIFINKGVIVTTESRGKEIDRREAHGVATEDISYPIIILVNGGTASASEIVAGAMQDHQRAVALGTQTFGKGSVQTVIEMDDGSALKLTIALYFTPKGRSIQAQGIMPDIIVEDQPPEIAKDEKRGIRERDLPGHLEVPPERIDTREGAKLVTKTGKLDYQKKVALDYLKSWEIFKAGTAPLSRPLPK